MESKGKHHELWSMIQDDVLAGDTPATNRYQYLLHGKSLELIAKIIQEEAVVHRMTFNAVAGPSMAGTLIVSAMLVHSYRSGGGLAHGAIYRTDPKYHGTARRVESCLPNGSRILMVDDTINTGNTMQAACNSLVNAGHTIGGIITLFDEELITGDEGSLFLLGQMFWCPSTSIFNASNFGPNAKCPYTYIGCIPPNQVVADIRDDQGLAGSMLPDH